MPRNTNPQVLELLSWHGHERGGVRVPFDDASGNPLRGSGGGDNGIIQTSLVRKLAALASSVAAEDPGPRLVFLVGGPGNGKSEAIQAFVYALDQSLGCRGTLVSALRTQLERQPGRLVEWQAKATAADAGPGREAFQRAVGYLSVVQDASASESPSGDAALQLVVTLSDLLARGENVLFLCCINRGVLARCRMLADQDPRYGQVAELATRLGEATAIGGAAGNSECWPLAPAPAGLEGRVACWPMDTESLLLAAADGGLEPTPIDQAFVAATNPAHWEVDGRCADCSSRVACPFRQNASWLSDDPIRAALLRILRRGELATGRRWNFRDTFSLVAELVVGERGDFLSRPHPCEWVHERVEEFDAGQPTAEALRASFQVLRHLFPHALFTAPVSAAPPAFKARVAAGAPLTSALQNEDRRSRTPASTYVRRLLHDEFAPRLDPALLSPHDSTHPLGQLEDDYSASVSVGNSGWPAGFPAAAAEQALLALLACAEEHEWDPQSRDAAVAARAIAYLRATGAVIAKRSVGARAGIDVGSSALDAYEALIRDPAALRQLRRQISSAILGDLAFEADPVEVYGQPRGEAGAPVRLHSRALGVQNIEPAPRPSTTRPAHDVPFVVVAGRRVPLTFDLFLAVRSRQERLSTGAISAAAQASLDRIRHLYAGQACRDHAQFRDGETYYVVQGHGLIGLDPDGTIYFEPEA